MELSSLQMKMLKEEDTKVQAVKVRRSTNTEKDEQQNAKAPSKKSVCNNCGYETPHKTRDNQCPAKGKQCKKCLKYNHFARVCKSKSSFKKVQTVEDDSDDDGDSDNDLLYLLFHQVNG